MAQQTQITDLSNTAGVSSNNELNVNLAENCVTFTADYAGAQAGVIILTPSLGDSFEIHNVFVSTDTTTTDVTLAFATSGIIIFKLYTTNFTAVTSQILHIDGAVNEPITLTCGADTFVSITYHGHS